MYGTVAHLRVKPGQEQGLVSSLEEFRRTRQARARGFVAVYLYRLDTKPQEYRMSVVFQDKAAYRANAEDPDQDRWYRRFREHLQADPQWEDGEIVFS